MGKDKVLNVRLSVA